MFWLTGLTEGVIGIGAAVLLDAVFIGIFMLLE